jgi:hypothetical protein
MSFGPRQADDIGEQHFGELMAESHVFGDGAAFASEADLTVAGNGDKVVAAHAFERGGNCGRSYAQFFSEARADGRLAFLEEFPDSFEVVFLRDAGFCSHAIDESCDCENGQVGFNLPKKKDGGLKCAATNATNCTGLKTSR